MSVLSNGSPLVGDEKLLTRLKQSTNLPSPPGVAARIIELGQDPAANVGAVAEAVSLDPALSAKMLRMANSPMYARQRKAENLRQVILMLGLNGTLNLALSFSLVNSFRCKDHKGMDYALFWRRSLSAAICSRLLGVHFQSNVKEELFLAALLQDIGMLALDKVVPDLYQAIGTRQANHQDVVVFERRKIGSDHANIGAWLLETWNFPDWILSAVANSHNPEAVELNQESELISRCVCVSAAMADILIREDHDAAVEEAADRANTLVGIDRAVLTSILDHTGTELKETAALFEVDLGDAILMDSLLDHAKEVLMQRNIKTTREISDLQNNIVSLENKVQELEVANHRDELTGLYNRRHLDATLSEELISAQQNGWPLSVAFIDLDSFKRINDSYGHQAGDSILQASANLITKNTRDSDIVVRYGGDEYVVVLVGTGSEGAHVTSERLINAFRNARHTLGESNRMTLTVSIGLVVHGEGVVFDNPEQLLRAADDALYSAKQGGRNQYIVYDPGLVVEI